MSCQKGTGDVFCGVSSYCEGINDIKYKPYQKLYKLLMLSIKTPNNKLEARERWTPVGFYWGRVGTLPPILFPPSFSFLFPFFIFFLFPFQIPRKYFSFSSFSLEGKIRKMPPPPFPVNAPPQGSNPQGYLSKFRGYP